MTLNQNVIRQLCNLIAVFTAFGVNLLANIQPIGGLTLGEISNELFEEVLITPANYAFAIWGVIYVGLFCFAVYQALPSQQEKPLFHRISYWLVAASLAQIVWVFLFQLRFFTWSFLAMLLILLPLLRIYSRLEGGEPFISRRERWFVRIPLSIYCAWISVATIVNGAVFLTAIEWDGWGLSPELWTAIMMGVGGAIVLLIAWTKRDIAFTGVFIWAYIAIAIRHLNIPMISLTGIILAILFTGVIFWRSQRFNFRSYF